MRFGAKGLMSTLMRVRISSDAPRCTVQFGALDPRCTMVQVHGDPNEPSLGAGAAGAPCVTLLSRQKCGSSVRIDREELPQHPHSVASTVGAPSCCGCWTRDWRAPSLPQVGTITVLNCVMAGAPASASRTPL